jgi:alkylated DNA nucleotide flippase Atl1
MAKKTFNEKLNHSGDLPKVVKIDDPRFVKIYKTTTMAIAAPLEYDQLMKKVPKGKVTTIDRMMAHMAKKHNAGCACPITAGLFVKIAAFASEERLHGQPCSKNETPWWRTLKKDGQLKEKFPDGIDGQRVRLEAEGHTIIQKGKRFLVESYEKKLLIFS